MGSPREERLAKVTRYRVHPPPQAREARGIEKQTTDSFGVRAHPTSPWRREVLTTSNEAQLPVLAIHAP